jgi:uncharacterized SAM-binding protein YcdF (DUF218 family)
MMPTADAIVVLGCAIRPGGSASAALGRRIALAARLFHGGAAKRVIASGGRRWGHHVEALVIERRLREQAVPAAAIVLELCSLSTLENGRFTADLLERLGGRRALLATCAWHMRRAIADFRRCGVEALAPPADWLDGPPASARLRLRENVCGWADSVMMPRDR